MRTLRYSVAMSLDGFIAGPNGEADWIVTDPEIDFGDLFARFDTLLMGRKTFAAAGAMGGTNSGPFAGLQVVVVSRTLHQADHPKVTIIGGALAAEVAALKQRDGKDIWLFGGGDLFRSLLDLGLVDGVGVAVIPVLLGQGLPLLPPRTSRATLTLTSHRVYPKTGTVSLEYAVARNAAGPATKRRRRSG
jgi:dihydrofolate reductase